MKKIFLLPICIFMVFACLGQSNYTNSGSSNSSFQSRYKMTVVFDEKNGVLNIAGDAPIKNVYLTSYTRSQFAARKGSDHVKLFPLKVRKFSYNMRVPGLKDRYYYWLKVYAADGALEEYLFKRKDSAPAVDEKAQDMELTALVDETEASPYEFYEQSDRDHVNGTNVVSLEPATIIKTNIICIAGKTKIINALKKLDGVQKVVIDIKTGKIKLYYSSDGTPYATILETINENGYMADGQPAKKGVINPCSGKN